MLLDVGIEHSILPEIMGHGVLREKGCLESNLRADPFALGVRLIGGVVAAPATAKLGAKISRLDLLEMLQVAPSLFPDGA